MLHLPFTPVKQLGQDPQDLLHAFDSHVSQCDSQSLGTSLANRSDYLHTTVKHKLHTENIHGKYVFINALLNIALFNYHSEGLHTWPSNASKQKQLRLKMKSNERVCKCMADCSKRNGQVTMTGLMTVIALLFCSTKQHCTMYIS